MWDNWSLGAEGGEWIEAIVKGMMTETCPKLMKYIIPQIQKISEQQVR